MSEAAPPSHRGRPKRISDEERQALLLNAAEHVFLERGYHCSTMDDLAGVAKMSKKTIYQIFPTKDALFEALIADRLSSLTIPVEEDDADLAASLTALMIRLAGIILSPRQIRLSRLMISEIWRSPQLARGFHQTGLGRGGGTLEKWMSRQIEKKRLTIQDPTKAANLLYGMALGELHIYLLMSMRSQPTGQEMRERISEAVALFLEGFESRPPAAAADAGDAPG